LTSGVRYFAVSDIIKEAGGLAGSKMAKLLVVASGHLGKKIEKSPQPTLTQQSNWLRTQL
jgi:hypothetical protein